MRTLPIEYLDKTVLGIKASEGSVYEDNAA